MYVTVKYLDFSSWPFLSSCGYLEIVNLAVHVFQCDLHSTVAARFGKGGIDFDGDIKCGAVAYPDVFTESNSLFCGRV